ncbi:hypothetical protein TNCV_3240771 [Trichonephila clavipes]|nr:hypothetical protein TNCV_3240771 [Trichonephila clavipes]
MDYRFQKDKLNRSGSSGAVKFKFFLEMDKILSSKDSTSPSEILETDILALNLSRLEIELVIPFVPNRDPPDTPQQSELGEVVHYHPSE